jgi:hypothetical protein
VIYLSGVVHPAILRLRPDLGLMLTERMGNRPDLSSMRWGADNGCFANPESFSREGYLAWLRSWSPAERAACLFATGPDVVGNAGLTLERSMPVLPLIREAGFPAALVAQNGLEVLPLDWSSFDVLFVGGDTAWKLSHSARELVREAKRRGKQTHMGRVNSLTRLQTAAMWGCDSADGTFLAFAPDHNVARLTRWLDSLNRQPVMRFA